jgi:hypothetical protein
MTWYPIDGWQADCIVIGAIPIVVHLARRCAEQSDYETRAQVLTRNADNSWEQACA